LFFNVFLDGIVDEPVTMTLPVWIVQLVDVFLVCLVRLHRPEALLYRLGSQCLEDLHEVIADVLLALLLAIATEYARVDFLGDGLGHLEIAFEQGSRHEILPRGPIWLEPKVFSCRTTILVVPVDELAGIAPCTYIDPFRYVLQLGSGHLNAASSMKINLILN
jgi:hypothetical protein